MRSFRSAVVPALIFSGLAAAQSPAPAPYRPPAFPDFNSIPRPPLPADPMEIVTGDAQPVQDAQQRIAAIGLLEKARKLSNVRAQPYDLKSSFIASGGLSSDGNWSLEDTARQRKYRWTAAGPGYSAVNLYPEGPASGLYSNQPSGNIPLRLLQVRSAMFFAYPTPGPRASLRTASGFLNGEPQNCLLVVIGAGARTFSGGRNWEESEYCVDSKTGLLTQYSPAPGIFVRYDYSSAIRFHDAFVPTAFTISENGRVVAEVRTMSVAEPPVATDPFFATAGLTLIGSGRAMNPGFNLPIVIPIPDFTKATAGTTAGAAMQMVTLHGNKSGEGKLSEIEILASTNAALNQAAIDRAMTWVKGRTPDQPGATTQSSEMFLTFGFITPGP